MSRGLCGRVRKLRKWRVLWPFCGGSWVPIYTMSNVAWAEAYLRTKWHLDPSNRLATIHPTSQTGQAERQRSDSIGRTVLQTVAQNVMIRCMAESGVKYTACLFASLNFTWVAGTGLKFYECHVRMAIV